LCRQAGDVPRDAGGDGRGRAEREGARPSAQPHRGGVGYASGARPHPLRHVVCHRARVTTLVIQGENDPFGRPEEFPDDTELVVVPAADHSLKVPKSGPLNQAEALAVVLEATLEWVVREVAGNRND